MLSPLSKVFLVPSQKISYGRKMNLSGLNYLHRVDFKIYLLLTW